MPVRQPDAFQRLSRLEAAQVGAQKEGRCEWSTTTSALAGEGVSIVDPIDRSRPEKIDPNDEMRAFYDRNPYPPPVRDLESYRRKWSRDDRLRYEFHLLWPHAPVREDLDILVAGCGTSQAARHAIRQPAARVTGIDISSISLRYTDELKRKYRLENLEVQDLPIEQVLELGDKFDKVICTGVLHHLPDPEEGLRALWSVLKPQEAMHLMVYAAYGRTGVHMLQSYARLFTGRLPGL